MANKAIFSYGNGGKRKIGHSKFDMGFEHIMSANFGALHPAAVYETLPDDYWDISDNTVTLLKPLTAPAMTRINQNFYAAYVRNQQIWKYWNDYISNGTAFADVYGNNVTNQSLQNVWDVPSIPTPYIQTILKMGYGNATPLFKVEFGFDPNDPGDSAKARFAQFLSSHIHFEHMSTGVIYHITDAVYAALQITNPTGFGDVLSSLNAIGFSDYGFDVHVVKVNDNWTCFMFELYCSLRQYLAFKGVVFGDNSFVMPSYSTIGENADPDTTDIQKVNVPFRFFCDQCSEEPKTSESAFIIEKSSYCGYKLDVLKSLDYYPRVVSPSFSVLGVEATAASVLTLFQCISSPFWGFRYVYQYNSVSPSLLPDYYMTSAFNYSTDFFWHIDASCYGSPLPTDLSVFEGWSSRVHYLGVTNSNWTDNLDYFKGAAYPIIYQYQGTSYKFADSFGHFMTISNSANHNIVFDSCCDLMIPINTTQFVNLLGNVSDFVSRDSAALGYDAISYITYLCKNSSELLDSMGIKVDPLCSRPFWHYRFELTNALPFFAYDKIWNDNFRNSVVSSPCLDWSESNGVMFADENFYRYFVYDSNFISPAVIPPRYNGKTWSDFKPNGWTLELTTFPRNAVTGAIHTHLPVNSFSRCFNLLTGVSFDWIFINSLGSVELNVNDYYIPSYYNGLLHLKFQNFNKDYFTSALLDPMSGANQVAVGSTINELRENEAKQHWWERTAMYRSIKNFFQGTYGITPIELPEDSRITGTDHIDVNIGEVIQTSGSTPESPQGTRTGLGGCRGSGTLCHGHANEHGWIIVLISHTIESQYLQTFDKMWDVKESFLDYPTVDFAGIGNESILQKEVNYTTQPTKHFDYPYVAFSGSANYPQYSFLPIERSAGISYRGRTNPQRKSSGVTRYFNIAQNAGTSLDNVFGFIPRYSSYKFKFDQVSGQFRHELNFWHTFKRYLTSPILCHEFVNWEMAADDDDINRIFAVSDDFLDDKFAIDCFINASVDRALPFVCVPMSK